MPNVITASSGVVLIVANAETVMVCGRPSAGDAAWPNADDVITATSVTTEAAMMTTPVHVRLLMPTSSE